MTSFNVGDRVRCTRARPNSGTQDGCFYVIRKVSPRGTVVFLEGIAGSHDAGRFERVPPKQTPFGQIKSVKVAEQDALHALTAYVQFTLGINATVEKIIQAFPDAVELVLQHKAAA